MSRSPLFILALASAAASSLSGCLVEQREVVRDERPPLSSPPPPPRDDRVESAAGPAASADEGDEVDEESFHERLSPYGHWTWVASYGNVWVPSVAYGWRPYYYGQWVLTDYGWTFVSDDPWGWAAYHYGRWNYGPAVGWYWIPGNVWGPAWVSWRYGGGYVTWCPLAPVGVVWDVYSPAWVVVPERHFTRPIATVAVGGTAAPHAVATATPLAGPHAAVGTRSGQFGPPVARIQAATGQTLRPVAAASVVRQPQGVSRGDGRASGSGAGRVSPSGGPGVRPASPGARPAPGGARPRRDEAGPSSRPRGASRSDWNRSGGYGRPSPPPGPRYSTAPRSWAPAAPRPAAPSGARSSAPSRAGRR